MIKIPRVLVTRKLPPLAYQRLKADKRVEVVEWAEVSPIPRQKLLNWIKGVDGALILLTDNIDAELLTVAGPQLKVISTMSVGYDHIDLDAVKRVRPDILIGNTPGILTDATAELTVGLLLATARRFQEATNAVKNGEVSCTH
jgi:glyoxylate/hydroxypyruvate reductase